MPDLSGTAPSASTADAHRRPSDSDPCARGPALHGNFHQHAGGKHYGDGHQQAHGRFGTAADQAVKLLTTRYRTQPSSRVASTGATAVCQSWPGTLSRRKYATTASEQSM